MQPMVETQEAERQKAEFSSRLRAAMQHAGFQSDAEIKATLRQWFQTTQEATRKWLTGQGLPKTQRIFEIASRCKVRGEWLASGIGPMRLDDEGPLYSQLRDSDDPAVSSRTPPHSWNEIPGFDEAPPLNSVRESSGDEYVTISFHRTDASAGDGAFNYDHEDIPGGLKFRARSLAKRHLNPGSLRNLFVRGDSMEPTLLDGDLVLIDTDQSKIIDGEIYGIVGPDGEARLKRLFRMLDGRIRVASDNPDKSTFPDETVDESTGLRIIGRFVWLARFNPKIK